MIRTIIDSVSIKLNSLMISMMLGRLNFIGSIYAYIDDIFVILSNYIK